MPNLTHDCEILIIGSGIAGASCGYFVTTGDHAPKTIMLEAESVPAYHTTGRSAAFMLPLYGGEYVAPVTKYSKQFYQQPPKGFTETKLISPRGALHIARPEQLSSLKAYYEQISSECEGGKWHSAAEVCGLVPLLSENYVAGGVFEPECYDLDVSAIHSSFLRGFKANGGELFTDAEAIKIEPDGEWWLVTSKAGVFKTKTIVNAAGAWGDGVAKMAGLPAIGLNPLRRTVTVFPVEDSVDKNWPLVLDVDEGFYFRPEGANILATPADETPSAPCDAQPEEEDVAKTIYDMEQATGQTINTIINKWAGLRTFTPDRVPAIGFAPDNENFFWCVGQGGFGIQTAAGFGRMSADIILNVPTDNSLNNLEVDVKAFSPERFYN